MSDAIFQELDSALRTVLERFRTDVQGVRSNRPSVELVENVKLDYYGQQMTIKQVGSLGVRPPRDIEITVWDKGAVGAVMKAIEDAKTGLSVSNDGVVIRATLPQLTDERRAEFTKLAKRMAEEARIQVRHHRDEAMKKLKAGETAKELTEDQVFTAKERAQKAVEDVNASLEKTLDEKIKELSA